MSPRPSPNVSRRRFLATSAAAATAAASVRTAVAAPQRPSVRLALIGVANRGAANTRGVASQTIAAVCDVDETYLDKAAARFPEAKRYRDYRELLEAESDLDGVVVSTPDHHHAPATIRALKRGLAVYCEKPLTHTVAEARAITEAARDAGVATQMGTQIHATNNYRRVVEQIRAGRIGDVSEVHVWVSKDWGADRMPEPDGEPAAKTLDWNRWLGPAPKRGYTSALHPANWRRYRPYGAGTLGDMGCHYIDLPFWALGLKYPDRVVADGPPPREKTCPHGLSVEYRFPATDVHDEIKLVWYDGRRAQQYVSGKEFPGSGVLFVGDRGKMLATYGSYEVFPKERAGTDLDVDTIPPSIGHHAEWIRAITGGPTPLCHFGYAGPLTETVLLGTVAHRAGRPLRWNGGRAEVVGDPEADALLRKEYRDGWEVAAAEREQKVG